MSTVTGPIGSPEEEVEQLYRIARKQKVDPPVYLATPEGIRDYLKFIADHMGEFSGDVTIAGDLKVQGGGTLTYDNLVQGSLAVIPPSTGDNAIIIRNAGDTADIIRITENGRIFFRDAKDYIASTGTGFISITANNRLTLQGYWGRIAFNIGGIERWSMYNTVFRPTEDNNKDLGASGYRIQNIYYGRNLVAKSDKSTSTETSKNSPPITFRGSYWDSVNLVSTDIDGTIFLYVTGPEKAYLRFNKAPYIIPPAGEEALVIRNSANTGNIIQITESSAMITSGFIFNLMNAVKFRTDSNATKDVLFQSYDGTAFQTCARLVGGYLEIPRGKLTGDLLPDVDSSHDIGTVTHRLRNIYSTRGYIDTLYPTYDMIWRGGTGRIRTDDTSTAYVSLQSHDGTSHVECARLVGGVIQIAKGRLTGDLIINDACQLRWSDVNLKRDVANVLWSDDSFVANYVCMDWAYISVNALLGKWGTDWNRKDTARIARLIDMGLPDPPFRFQYADAGANPITWTTLMDLTKEGALKARYIQSNRGIVPYAELTPAGNLYLHSENADATNSLRNSPTFFLRARYWDGTSSVDTDAKIHHRIDTTAPTSRIWFEIDGHLLCSMWRDGTLGMDGHEVRNVRHKACNVTSGIASASGTANVYGTPVTISPPSGYYGIIPIAIKYSCTAITSGTTLTIKLVANRDDGTTASATYSFTATGDYWAPSSTLAILIKDGCAITSFEVSVASTGTGTTTDQGTVTIVGRYT